MMKLTSKTFADADLIGYPHRIVISEKGLDAGQYEYKRRSQPDTAMIPMTAAIATLRGEAG